MDDASNNLRVWVIDETPSETCRERLGDARRLASAMDSKVAVLLTGGSREEGEQLIQHGADIVFLADQANDDDQPVSVAQKVRTTRDVMQAYQPWVVLAGGDPPAREWAALLAADQSWQLVSPALLVTWRSDKLVVTRLNHSGRRSCRVALDSEQTVVVTMRPGVAEGLPAETERIGQLRKITVSPAEAPVVKSQRIPADPARVDIRHADRLVAGGRGLGDRAGFELLGRFAETIGAGVAASRMAVDLGWIDSERQVGQTGKTVQPDLYIACGISGASHHLQGMAKAEHILAINTDPDAPIFQNAHLGLVSDLYEVLENALRRLED